MQKLQGFTEAGNTTLTITGAAGTIARKVQGSFPGCIVGVYFTGIAGIQSGTYTSGGTITGSAGQTVGLTFTGGGGAGATATCVLTGANTIAAGTALTITNPGYGYTSAPTAAVLTSGTATATGNAVVATVIGNVLASIYGDDILTPKANPFTSAADGTWFAYVTDGHYDVRFSGGGIATPFTVGDLMAFAEDNLWVNVKASPYNATGNGTTDDTVSLQRALTAASPGSIIVMPPGTYGVRQAAATYALTPGNNLTIRGTAGLTTIKLLSATTDCCILGKNTEVDNLILEDIIFDGNSTIAAVETSGLWFGDIRKITIRNCKFINFTRDGATLGLNFSKAPGNSSDVTVTECWFESITWNGVRTYLNTRQYICRNQFIGFIHSPIDTNPQNILTNTSTIINHNYIENSTSWVVPYSSISLMGDYVECVGNTIINGGEIVVHQASGFSGHTLRTYKVLNNTIIDSATQGILVNQDINTDILVSGNTIRGAGASSILVFNGSPLGTTLVPTIITKNTIDDTSTDTTYLWADRPSAIDLEYANNVLVEGNYVTTPRWAGIAIFGYARNITVRSNEVYGHQGIAPTDSVYRYGAGIIVCNNAPYSVTIINNIVIDGNTVYNFLTSLTTPTTQYSYAAGISVSNEDTAIIGPPAPILDHVTVRNNTVIKGKGMGIQVRDAKFVTVEGNTVFAVFTDTPIYIDSDSESSDSNKIDPTFRSSAPANGSHRIGEAYHSAAPTPSGYIGWVCTASGTFGTLAGVTGGISISTSTLTVNSATDLKVGQFITIVGVTGTKEIIGIAGTTITLNSDSDATVVAAAVAFAVPVFKGYGAIAP